jgi:hypothetical protein
MRTLFRAAFASVITLAFLVGPVSAATSTAGSSDVTIASGTSVDVNVALTQASLNNLNVIGRTGSNGGGLVKFDISSTPSNTLTQGADPGTQHARPDGSLAGTAGRNDSACDRESQPKLHRARPAL